MSGARVFDPPNFSEEVEISWSLELSLLKGRVENPHFVVVRYTHNSKMKVRIIASTAHLLVVEPSVYKLDSYTVESLAANWLLVL